MPRVGQNPLKWTPDVHHAKELTVTTIVFIPQLQGYWAQSLDVLKVCLHSLHNSTSTTFDLMVFDNGSCPDVQDYLVELENQGVIQYLVLSNKNVGKTGALNVLFSAAPGEMVAYFDSDAFFFPGWLEQSIEIMRMFPQTGMVSAQSFRWAQGNCPTTWAAVTLDRSIVVRKGRLLSELFLKAQRAGLGYAPERYQEKMNEREDTLISKNGVAAYVGAVHFQFLATKETLWSILPLPVTRPVNTDEAEIERRIDRSGRWLLSTPQYLVHHMGNELPTADTGFDGLVELFPEMDFTELFTPTESPLRRSSTLSTRMMRILLRRARVKRALKRLNVLTYRLYTSTDR